MLRLVHRACISGRGPTRTLAPREVDDLRLELGWAPSDTEAALDGFVLGEELTACGGIFKVV